MDSVNLMGAEDVRRAAAAMQEAAIDIKHAASWISEALDKHQRAMDYWMARFEAILNEDHLRRLNNGR